MTFNVQFYGNTGSTTASAKVFASSAPRAARQVIGDILTSAAAGWRGTVVIRDQAGAVVFQRRV